MSLFESFFVFMFSVVLFARSSFEFLLFSLIITNDELKTFVDDHYMICIVVVVSFFGMEWMEGTEDG